MEPIVHIFRIFCVSMVTYCAKFYRVTKLFLCFEYTSLKCCALLEIARYSREKEPQRHQSYIIMVLRKANKTVITEPQLKKRTPFIIKLIHYAPCWPVQNLCQSLARDKDSSQSIPALINTDRWSARVEELTGPASDPSSLRDSWPLFHHRSKTTAR